MLDGVIETNAKQPDIILKLLKKHVDTVTGVNVTVLGLAFKPGTDDIRESPSMPIIKQLIDDGAKVTVYDPHAMDVAAETALANIDSIQYAESVQASIQNAQAIVVATAWPEFANLPKLIAGANPAPLVIDGRRVFEPNSIERYEGVGRGPAI